MSMCCVQIHFHRSGRVCPKAFLWPKVESDTALVFGFLCSAGLCFFAVVSVTVYHCTRWKINMEPTNHPNLERKLIWTKPPWLCSMLIFQGCNIYCHVISFLLQVHFSTSQSLLLFKKFLARPSTPLAPCSCKTRTATKRSPKRFGKATRHRMVFRNFPSTLHGTEACERILKPLHQAGKTGVKLELLFLSDSG